MEFVDACRARMELCNKHTARGNGCTGCVLESYYCQLPTREDSAVETERILSAWREEHPIKTMADHFFECFPNAPKRESGVPDVCCKRVGLATPEICGEMEDCDACWCREWQEEK